MSDFESDSAAARRQFASLRKPQVDPNTAHRLGRPEAAEYRNIDVAPPVGDLAVANATQVDEATD